MCVGVEFVNDELGILDASPLPELTLTSVCSCCHNDCLTNLAGDQHLQTLTNFRAADLPHDATTALVIWETAMQSVQEMLLHPTQGNTQHDIVDLVTQQSLQAIICDYMSMPLLHGSVMPLKFPCKM